MEDRIVKFYIAGVETSEKDIHRSIPAMYQDMFEGHHFKDAREFGQALMCANSAEEALIFNRGDLFRRNDNSVRYIIEKGE